MPHLRTYSRYWDWCSFCKGQGFILTPLSVGRAFRDYCGHCEGTGTIGITNPIKEKYYIKNGEAVWIRQKEKKPLDKIIFV